MLGQESNAPLQYLEAERAPTSKEMELWDQAERAKNRTILLAYAMRIRYQQIRQAFAIASENNVPLNEPDLAKLESQMISALRQIKQIRLDHCDVTGMKLGVSLSSSGEDLDIVRPPAMTSLGAIWVPIVIGAVVVAGIIARWAYLETEVQRISDQYNGILRRADNELCADPSSAACQRWKETKAGAAYQKNETLLDSLKSAASKVGTIAKTGIGIGLAALLPLLALMYLPRRRNG